MPHVLQTYMGSRRFLNSNGLVMVSGQAASAFHMSAIHTIPQEKAQILMQDVSRVY
jgi:hypothetical protein